MKNELIFVYCNDKMIGLIGSTIPGCPLRPTEYSDPIVTSHRVMYTAEYRIAELEKVAQFDLDAEQAFWVEIGSYDKTQEHWNDYVITRHYRRKKMLQLGLFDYLWDTYGIGSPKGIAHAIYNICVIEGMTPIQLFNLIEKWNRRKKK